MMEAFLTSNEWPWRLARTIVQGVLGVVVANVDMLVGCAVLAPGEKLRKANAAAPMWKALRTFLLSPSALANRRVNSGAMSAQSENREIRKSTAVSAPASILSRTFSLTYRMPKHSSRLKIMLNPQKEMIRSPLYASEKARQNGISETRANTASRSA